MPVEGAVDGGGGVESGVSVGVAGEGGGGLFLLGGGAAVFTSSPLASGEGGGVAAGARSSAGFGAGAAAGGASSAGAAAGAGAWARASAAASARPFMGAGAYATLGVMTSAPRGAWGDLATTAFVEASVLFKAFEPDARRDLLQLAQVVDYAQGEVVSPVGDDGFLLLLSGTGAVLANGPSGPVVLYRLERGAYYGVGRVLGQPRETWLAAETDLSAVVFPSPVVGAMVERCPKAKKLLEAVRAARLRESASRLAS